MTLLWLILTVAHAAKPAVCTADLSEHIRKHRRDAFWLPQGYTERAILPSVHRLQRDACRCLPRRLRRRPEVVMGQVHVEPNAGRVAITYTLRGEDHPRLTRMLRCMGSPQFLVEPMPYTSDIVRSDGRKGTIPPFPLWLHMVDAEES